MNRVTVVDYGLGNLHSVARGLRAAGAGADITNDPDLIASAERLVLPGVGAFGDGMEKLKERRLVEPIIKFVATGRPLIGICLGMQLLMGESEEFGLHQGLDLLPGRVTAMQPPSKGGPAYKVPHIGWNVLLAAGTPEDGRCAGNDGNPWDGTIFSDVREGDYVYFVHSFVVIPSEPGHELARTLYGGQSLCAAVHKDNIYGCQFHPEKSGEVGLRILRQFVNGGG